MESHFERVLAAPVAAKRPAASTLAPLAAKQPRVSPRAIAAQISAVVDGAEEQEGDTLDARSLKSMANSLLKQVQRNALDREKHADEPLKFLESELALDLQLKRWQQVAAKPELFGVMMELQVPRVLLGLFGHENADIQLAVLSLLAELTEVDDAVESLGSARELAHHLVDEKLLPLLINNLFRLAAAADDVEKDGQKAEEETLGMYHSLQILENLIDLEPHVCVEVAVKTEVLPFLLQQVVPTREFSENKLYASEILSILLQSGAEPRAEFAAWSRKERRKEETETDKNRQNRSVNLVDDLLQAISPYRKKNPASDEEEEMVGNLVNALCSALLVSEAQTQFRHLEGLELLLRCMKDRRQFVFGSALRGLDHALMGNARNCERMIEIGGLCSVFSVFMGRLGKHKSCSNSKSNKVNERALQEENVVSIIASMCAWVRQDAPADVYDRLHGKFVENDMEKIDRLVDLFAKYHERVERSNHVDEMEAEGEDEESRYLRRLDAGLFVLERIAFVVAHLCHFSKKLRAYVMIKFHERSIDSASLAATLRNQLGLLVADEDAKKDSDETRTKSGSDVVNNEAKEAHKAQLQQLLETLEAEEYPPADDENESTEQEEAKTDEKD
uniref:Beta-catenin-like protein 1 N-terminal domain-containing protein n=1 Tax=Peronospora matthiolae TaxID=2874970 RepID=A0AAV1UUC7_9STRA